MNPDFVDSEYFYLNSLISTEMCVEIKAPHESLLLQKKIKKKWKLKNNIEKN